MKLFSGDLLGDGLFRYLHILAGVTWIGLLYYFNLVQVPALAEYGEEGKARNITIDKVARRALWWFRWASIATLATGILITGAVKNYFLDFMGETDKINHVGHDAAISIGMLIGILMAANVWMIIWKNQKVVLANVANVLAGGEANADAPTAGRRALLASRQNMIFSVSMLFFMVGGAHMYQAFVNAKPQDGYMLMMIVLVIVALFELNAIGIFGGIKAGNKMLWPYESHKNALITSGILWVVVVALSEILLG